MKYSVRFNLKGKTPSQSDDQRRHIRLRVSWAGQRVEMLTGFQTLPAYWDTEEQRVSSRYRHKDETGASINKELASITVHIDQFFAKKQIEGHIPTKEEALTSLRQYFGAASPVSTDMPLFDCFDLFITDMQLENGWAKGTQTKIMTIKKHLAAFSPSISFADLTHDTLHQFMKYLMQCGLRNVTIAKNIDVLRWFLRWAYRHGYNTNNDFEAFRPKLKGSDGTAKEIIYLEWDELMRLFDFDFGEKHAGLSQVRDVFCFCCFTGLRYSDARKLRLSDIKQDYISIVTQKTTDALRIELNDFSRAILARCSAFQTSLQNKAQKALPVISNQKMNTYLKTIAERVGIDTPIRIVYYAGSDRIENVYPKHELITTHCARRTFVVNALRLGIPAEVIMKWTGHSDFKSMRPYVKIVDDLKRQEMDKFNRLNNIPRKLPEN
ncbi:MAG: site-specific integrase [Bacteroidales bacterium]|nr:site-specific integrase [Bacteroidales bacterium]